MRYLIDTNIFLYLTTDVGLLDTGKNETEMVLSIEKRLNIKISPVKKEHLLTYAALEINKVQDHNDPSDHIIISQAITEKMPLISSDQKFQFYTKQKLEFINNFK